MPADDMVAGQRDLGLDPTDGTYNVLLGALRNPDTDARFSIVNALLDAGWAVMAGQKEQFELLVPCDWRSDHLEPLDRGLALFTRLVDLGCDPRALEERGYRPLTDLVVHHLSEAELEPFYDVVFASPTLDLTTRRSDGVARWEELVSPDLRARRPQLVERVRDHLDALGVQVRLGREPRLPGTL